MDREKKIRRPRRPRPDLQEIVEVLAAASLRGSLREGERALLKRFLQREPRPRPDRPAPLDERFCPVCMLHLGEPRPEVCPGCGVVLAVAWAERRRMLRRQKEH